ncbi:MAG: Serine/threonine protein kinase [Myxococcaceae bacterium]|nr:Serine/threonine protein kinase [Myxococcaceae bacterium]
MPSLLPVPASSSSDRPAPRLIAHRYEVKEQIAHGGMGTVYRVLDRSTGQERALKRVLVRNPARKSLYTSAFEREYQVLAGLDHPRIIRVFDYGVDAEGPYYTMELVRGRDLESGSPRPWREVCLHLRDVATSLSLLHARRLLHRDLSPGNVKIGEDGHCKLLDFGALSDFGFTSFIVGTPPMVPPEALRGDLLDQRADLYALGALAYWSLTGVHAFPAPRIDDLPLHWETLPRAPSALVHDVPKSLDSLVLALLNADPLARPSSAAEVITRLNVIGHLAVEDEAEQRRLAQSFLIVPPFVGRDEELDELGGHIRAAMNGQGSAVRVEAMAGSGRSRLLEEIGVRAQITGATVLRADASMHPNQHGTSRALALRLLDALPDIARERGKRFATALHGLGRDVEALLGVTPSRPPLAQPPDGSLLQGELDDWIVEVSQQKPLVIEVDNVEYCDDASLGLLVALSNRARNESLFVVVAERMSRDRKPAKGLSILREHCQTLLLSNLAASETLALARSLFGDAPNVERFADWLHGRTAGSPLHCIEISRQLVARDVIQHEGGMWALPASRPHVELPEALDDALSIRLARLGPQALSLAQGLSLQRGEPTLELCRLLVENPKAARGSEQETLALLDELARCDVLHRDQTGYRFSSMALRESLLAHMDEHACESSHRRLGQAFVRLAGPLDHGLKIEAGWHLIQGGDELRGANLIALVLSEGYASRTLSANNYRLGPPSEAALSVYKRHRRSAYQRLPLLAALAQAGYYEEFHWNARYGDEALDVLEDVSGMRLARRLTGYFGRYLALPLALMFACLRFYLTPKGERTYSFLELLHQLFSTVTALVGAATISLDADRADRIASVLRPFAVLPEKMAPRGIHDFCAGLQQIGREHQAEAFATFDVLAKRFDDPRYYRELPLGGRQLFSAAAHFARGAFAVFRAHSEPALESAARLDASGLKLYAMIASQLRFLYHANRGELPRAVTHRQLVELHAAHVGSAWQVELWEAAALMPSNISMGDVLTMTRISHRLHELARNVPSLQFYRRLGEMALRAVLAEGSDKLFGLALHEVASREPRSFIGWTTVHSVMAATYNSLGRYEEARAVCERALVTMTDADREYVGLFLEIDIQAAIADAGLGHTDLALARIEGLIERFRDSNHPLALGLLYEARARIAYPLGRKRAYQHSLTQVEHHFRDTGTPALIAKFERLAELSRPQDTSRERPVGAPRELLTPVPAKNADRSDELL